MNPEDISLQRVLDAFPPDFTQRAIQDALLMVVIFIIIGYVMAIWRAAPGLKNTTVIGETAKIAGEVQSLTMTSAVLEGDNLALKTEIDLLIRLLNVGQEIPPAAEPPEDIIPAQPATPLIP